MESSRRRCFGTSICSTKNVKMFQRQKLWALNLGKLRLGDHWFEATADKMIKPPDAHLGKAKHIPAASLFQTVYHRVTLPADLSSLLASQAATHHTLDKQRLTKNASCYKLWRKTAPGDQVLRFRAVYLGNSRDRSLVEAVITMNSHLCNDI